MGKGIKGQREFDGVTYFLSGSAVKSVSEAKAEVRELKSKGLRARLVRHKKGASVYGSATGRRSKIREKNLLKRF
jgi:hypothetical protein